MDKVLGWLGPGMGVVRVGETLTWAGMMVLTGKGHRGGMMTLARRGGSRKPERKTERTAEERKGDIPRMELLETEL